MDRLFPFGFPAPTAFYLVLYVATLVIHVAFMNYVLAGSAYLATVSLFTGGPHVERQRSPMALVIRDWMPLFLSAAITAAVAPLLFLQILYKEQFYTANLLLFHRWMAILPVLIVGFYLFYLLRSRYIGRWSTGARVLVGFGAFLTIAFTGYSWTENHLLSLDRTAWTYFYASGHLFYWSPRLLPRLGLWFAGAFPNLAVIVGWQLWYGQRHGRYYAAAEVRRGAAFALFGLLLSVLAGGLYYLVSDQTVRAQFTGRLAGPYFVAAVAGLVLQAAAWGSQYRRATYCVPCLTAASIGAVVSVAGMTVVREAVRLAALNMTTLYPQHAWAASVGGLGVFVAFFVLNTVLVAWCFRVVRQNRLPSA